MSLFSMDAGSMAALWSLNSPGSAKGPGGIS